MTIPFKGSPAKKAGLKKGDVIISVDGFDIQFDNDEYTEDNRKTLNDAVSKIKGPAGTLVKLKIIDFCDNQEKEITVVRGPINHFSSMIEDSYFVNTKQEEIFKECPPESKISHYEVDNHTPNPDQSSSQQAVNQTPDNQNHGEQKEFIAPLAFEALYVPIKTFLTPTPEQLCDDFLQVQN